MSKPFLLFSFFHILFVIKIHQHLWYSDKEGEWNMIYFELHSKYFVRNKRVTIEKHDNVKLFLQFYTFSQCLCKSEKTFSQKMKNTYFSTMSRFFTFGPFRNTHSTKLAVAFITCMKSIKPVIGELHLPFLLILPMWKFHAAKQTYAWIHPTNFKHTFESTRHCL